MAAASATGHEGKTQLLRTHTNMCVLPIVNVSSKLSMWNGTPTASLSVFLPFPYNDEERFPLKTSGQTK